MEFTLGTATILKRNGITVDQFLKEERKIFWSGNISETYKEAISILNTDFHLNFSAMYLDRIGFFLWEVSIAAVMRDAHDPRRELGEVVEGSTEWGFEFENNRQKAIRKAAKNFVNSLEDLEIPEE